MVLENARTVMLHAPKGSATMKSSEKGVGQAIHTFSFSQVWLTYVINALFRNNWVVPDCKSLWIRVLPKLLKCNILDLMF